MCFAPADWTVAPSMQPSELIQTTRPISTHSSASVSAKTVKSTQDPFTPNNANAKEDTEQENEATVDQSSLLTSNATQKLNWSLPSPKLLSAVEVKRTSAIIQYAECSPGRLQSAAAKNSNPDSADLPSETIEIHTMFVE